MEPFSCPELPTSTSCHLSSANQGVVTCLFLLPTEHKAICIFLTSVRGQQQSLKRRTSPSLFFHSVGLVMGTGALRPSLVSLNLKGSFHPNHIYHLTSRYLVKQIVWGFHPPTGTSTANLVQCSWIKCCPWCSNDLINLTAVCLCSNRYYLECKKSK